MDPLSIASSAAGIAGLCIKVSGILYTFIDDARGVDESVSGLCEEINGLQRALNAIAQAWKQNPSIAAQETNGDRGLWITVRGSLDDCEVTLGKLDKRLVEVQKTGSFLGRGFLRKPTMSIKLNMMMKDITAFRQQIHSHNSAMQSAFQMINVLLLLKSGSSQESISRVLDDLKNQIGRVEVAVQTRNDTEPPSRDVQEDDERISRNLTQFVRVAESFISSASTVVGEGTVWGGSVYGDPLSDDQAQRIENWIPPPTIEEEGTEADELVRSTTEDVKQESDSDPDSDMERDLVKNFHNLAIRSFSAGDYPNAERFFSKVVNRSTDDLPGGIVKIKLMQAYSYGKQARWRDAESVLAGLTSTKKVTDPLAFDGLHALALLKLQGDAHDPAIRYCKKALLGRRRLGGKESAPFYESMALLALIHERKGDTAEAEGCRVFLPDNYKADVESSFMKYLAGPLRDHVRVDQVSDLSSGVRLPLQTTSPLSASSREGFIGGSSHTPDSLSTRSTGPSYPPQDPLLAQHGRFTSVHFASPSSSFQIQPPKEPHPNNAFPSKSARALQPDEDTSGQPLELSQLNTLPVRSPSPSNNPLAILAPVSGPPSSSLQDLRSNSPYPSNSYPNHQKPPAPTTYLHARSPSNTNSPPLRMSPAPPSPRPFSYHLPDQRSPHSSPKPYTLPPPVPLLQTYGGSSATSSKAQLIIGVDVGNTDTSVSFAYVNGSEVREDSVTDWPGPKAFTKPRIPSSIYYDLFLNVVGWGHDTADVFTTSGYPKSGITEVKWFHVYSQLVGSSQSFASMLPPLPAGKSAAEALADYLFRVRQATSAFLEKTLGLRIAKDQSIVRYYFSTPSIWNDGARTAFRKAIAQAGYVRDVNDRRLTLLSAPEASAQYCSRTGLLNLKQGDAILVVDCGTGTYGLVVDRCSKTTKAATETRLNYNILPELFFRLPRPCLQKISNKGSSSVPHLLPLSLWIHANVYGRLKCDLNAFQVESENPFELKECTNGSGDSCGSSTLNRNFSDIVRKRMTLTGLPGGSKTLGRVFAKCVMDFENRIKDDFQNNGQKWAVDVGIETDFLEAGIEEGYMVFTNEEIRQCFSPVIGRILELVTNQDNAIKAQHITLKTMLVIGAWKSNYLLNQIKAHTSITVVRPMDSELSVVKGLVTLGILDMHRIHPKKLHSAPSTESYHPTINYYLSIPERFVFGVHDERFRVSGPDHDRCLYTAKQIARIGEQMQTPCRIPTSKMIQLDYDYSGRPRIMLKDTLWVCGNTLEPDRHGKTYLHTNQQVYIQPTQGVYPVALYPDIIRAADITIDFSRYDPDRAFRKFRNEAGVWYLVEYEIVVHFPKLDIEVYLEGKRVHDVGSKVLVMR